MSKTVTISKAFKIRKNMKAFIASEIQKLSGDAYVKYDMDAKESVEGLAEATLSKQYPRFDGRTCTEQLELIMNTIDQLDKLNQEIEKQNQKVHILLMRETALKSKKNIYEDYINSQRCHEHMEEVEYIDKETEYVNGISTTVKTPKKYVFVKKTNIDFVKEVKDIEKQIDEIRDEITATDALTKIDVSFLDDMWA